MGRQSLRNIRNLSAAASNLPKDLEGISVQITELISLNLIGENPKQQITTNMLWSGPAELDLPTGPQAS
jgi:hypothetical protein